MEDLKLIYDFADRLPRVGTMLLPLVFVVIGLVIFFYFKKVVSKNETPEYGSIKRRFGMAFGILFAAISGIICAFIIPAHLNEYIKTKKIYNNKTYQIVEGNVESYHPMPEGGHDSESFTVKGIPFKYSDYELTDYGYNNATSKGGVIKEGLYVKISYFNNGDKNVILRLETE